MEPLEVALADTGPPPPAKVSAAPSVLAVAGLSDAARMKTLPPAVMLEPAPAKDRTFAADLADCWWTCCCDGAAAASRVGLDFLAVVHRVQADIARRSVTALVVVLAVGNIPPSLPATAPR